MTNANPSNVTPITDKQAQPLMKFKISCLIDNFPVEITGEGRADMKTIIDRLKMIGAEPPTTVRPEPTKAAGVPSCPEHGKAKQSKKPGSFYCPTALPDGGYCQWTGKA